MNASGNDPGRPPTPVGKDAVQFVPAPCGKGAVPASAALTNQALYDNLVDSFSMRAFVPREGINGHDQFFSTFARFGGMKDVAGEWLDEVATRAAAQNEQYLEIMQTPTFSNAAKLAAQIGWPTGAEKSVTHETLAILRDKLLAAGLRSEVAVDSKEFADAKLYYLFSECQGFISGNAVSEAKPACGVKIHWLYQVLRGFPPQRVFAQTLLGFEVASVDPDVVGINFVMPEDGRVSMQDYHLQMQMLDYLHSVYPRVHISLHAGELAPGLVPPEGLRFHIREAIELGHAERIGHGVDVLYEDNAFALLREMAAKHIDVEINLTSNDGILGVKGDEHHARGLPGRRMCLSRSPPTMRASAASTLRMSMSAPSRSRASATSTSSAPRATRSSTASCPVKAFTAGQTITTTSSPSAMLEGARPSSACSQFLGANEKAARQWELERRFAAFEDGVTQPLRMVPY